MTLLTTTPTREKLSARAVVLRVVMGLCTWAVVATLVMLQVLPQKQALTGGEIAGVSIKASRDIVDELTTERKRETAIANVTDKYQLDDAITTEVVSRLEDSYAAMDTVRADGAKEIANLNNGTTSAAYRDTANDLQFTDWFLQQCHDKLAGSFTPEDVRYILLADDKMLTSLQEKVMELVKQALKNGVKTEVLSDQISKVNQEIINPLNRFDDGAMRLGMNLVSTYLQANVIYDADATAAARQKASDDVQEEIYKRGQFIVREGYPVTEAQIKMLSDLGLLDDNSLHLQAYLGMGLFTGVLLLLLWLYLVFFENELFRSTRRMLMFSMILVFTTALMWLAGKVPSLGTVLLSATGLMLTAVLLNNRLAIVSNAVLAILAGVMTGSDSTGAFTTSAMPAVMAALAGGFAALYIIRHTPQRTTLMVSGILAGLTQLVIFVSVDLMASVNWKTMLVDAAGGLGGGLAAAMLSLGTLPLWEIVFKVVTPMKLLELSNPNHPLLRRLLIEAPGTYHHSIIVGNLAESAADAIGANPLLTRAGAYYHDVGKLQRPYFFTENQISGENPHESITPELSKRILTSHPRDGVELAARYGLPHQIQEIIREHHGTTPTMYFYHKAVQQAENGETVELDDYRYPGPKPSSREAALIMLADSVEAGARTLEEHTQERLDEFVQQVVNTKLEDGQFDNCELTLRDIGIVTAEFRKVLGGIYHERVVYPTLELPKKERAV